VLKVIQKWLPNHPPGKYIQHENLADGRLTKAGAGK
jgi:hypothetical protein